MAGGCWISVVHDFVISIWPWEMGATGADAMLHPKAHQMSNLDKLEAGHERGDVVGEDWNIHYVHIMHTYYKATRPCGIQMVPSHQRRNGVGGRSLMASPTVPLGPPWRPIAAPDPSRGPLLLGDGELSSGFSREF